MPGLFTAGRILKIEAMAAIVAAVVLVLFALAYRFYARWLGRRVYGDGEEIVTPAHALRDGRDYVPAGRHVLFGHHFTSIAGAAPIIGPCVAAYWGWVPALIWVVLGTVLMGAVHDFGALVVSVREKGRSIADIAGGVLGQRGRVMFLCFVAVLVWLVLAVFAMAIAGLFVGTPSSVLPVNIEILVALVIGWMLHKRGASVLWPSLVALAILYFFVWIGVTNEVDFRADAADLSANQVGWTAFGWSDSEAKNFWIFALFGYSAIASLLPVWLLLQPRDFINSHQLVVGLGLLFAGLFLAAPDFGAPAIRAESDSGAPIFPLLFVTVACGAISGFHGLVSSGTTSKQLDRMADARPVGYGAMLGEGALAMASLMAAVAGIELVDHCVLPAQGAVADLSWSTYYDTWAHAGANKAQAFVLGGGQLLSELGLSSELARTLMAVLVISFAATTLDTATRIQRMLIAELGGALAIRPLQQPVLATVIAVVPAMALAFLTVTDPVSGKETQAGWVLWPIFGASNQMLAGLTLLVLTLYFRRLKRPTLPLLLPMVFVMVITFVSLLSKTADFWRAEHWPLLGLSIVQLALVTWLSLEGIARLRRPNDPN